MKFSLQKNFLQFLPLTPFILLLVFLLLRYKMEPLPVIVVSCIITLLVSVYFLKTANAKKLKAQLLRDEEQYSNMLGEVEDYAILMLDTEGNIRNWNKGAERIKGYSAKEAIGKNFRMFYTRSDQEARLPEKLLGIAILQGRTAHEGWRVKKDGSLFWGNVVITALHDDKGTLTGFIKLTRDLTERKNAEEHLQQLNQSLEQKVQERTAEIYKNEKRYRALVENNYDIISMVDASFTPIFRSPSTSRVTGWSDEEILGSNGTMNIHPDDQEKARSAIDDLLVHPGKTVQTSFRVRHKDSHYIWMEGSMTNLLEDKDVCGIVFNLRDVTSRIEAEEKIRASELLFRTLIENSAEGISLTDVSYHTFFKSPSALRILGNTSLADLGKIAHPDDLAAMNAVREKTLQTPRLPVFFNARFLLSAGAYRWIEGSLTNLLEVKGVNAVVANFRDITQRKDAETAIVQSEKQYRELVERISEGFMAMDLEWRVTYINPAGEDMLLKPYGYLTGKKMDEEFSDTKDRPLFKAYEDAVSGKQNIYREAYSPVLEKWLSMSLFYSPTGVSIFFRNITAQRKAQEEARLQEEKYSMLVQRITDAFIALDKQWNYTYLNKQAGELIHHDPASLIGKNVWEVFPDAVGSKTYEAFHQAMKAQRFISNEDYYAPLDLWQENHIYPSPDGLTIFIRNITEKKKAEEQIRKANERFELVVNATNDVIWDWDIPSNAMWWNKNYYDHFGYDKDSTIHNVSSWQAGVHPEDRDRVIAGIRSSMQSGEQVWTDEYRFLKADGSICFILDYGYILYDKGNAYRMVGAMLDITGIKNAEQDIRRLEKERMESRMEEQKRITQAILQAQEKERNAIGIELHDNVNQILAGTKLLLSIGMNYPDRDAEIIPAALKNIEEAIEENRKIAHELVAPDFQEIRLASQLQQLAEDMLQKAGLDSYIEDAGFDEKILSDEQKLAVYRIVQEQCTNILKYAGASTVRFQLATEGLMFKMEIADDGKGMDPGKLVTGIGLRNIRSRIHVFNGELDITTAPGKGFLLEIRMPLKK